mmetsp:Transcript_4190/g.10680  ORF Transcript_4190/g.10680 Transcript_4190/m.10680 type:complete len:221 (-) Transcript_4190:865-1527(-)
MHSLTAPSRRMPARHSTRTKHHETTSFQIRMMKIPRGQRRNDGRTHKNYLPPPIGAQSCSTKTKNAACFASENGNGSRLVSVCWCSSCWVWFSWSSSLCMRREVEMALKMNWIPFQQWHLPAWAEFWPHLRRRAVPPNPFPHRRRPRRGESQRRNFQRPSPLGSAAYQPHNPLSRRFVPPRSDKKSIRYVCIYTRVLPFLDPICPIRSKPDPPRKTKFCP